MSIFPNCVRNVRAQSLSDFVKFKRRVMQIILVLLSCDLTTSKDQTTEQSLHDENKITNERQVNICDVRIYRDMCIFVIIYHRVPLSLKFFWGGAYARYAFP